MSNKSLAFLLFAFLFIYITNAQTTYYCDPVSGNNGNDGSQATPFSTFGSVNWANVGLQDNDIIMLLDGQHGNGFMINQQFATNLLIQAENPNLAVLTKLQLNTSSNITFKDIKVDASTGSFDKNDPIVIGDIDTHYITMDNCLVQAADDSSTWTQADWYNNTASGVQFRGDNITLTNNMFLNLYQAVEVRGDYTLMQNNTILNFAADAIRGLGSNCAYENNIIKNCFIDDYAIQHDDAFQAFQTPGSALISNVTFRNNTIILFENPSQFVTDNDLIGTLMQGVIITDGNAEGWIVENNLVINSQSHGITLYGAQNCRIQNNTVIQSQYVTELADVPWVSVQDQGKSGGRVNQDNIIRNNIAGRFTTWTYGTNTTDENNIDIDQSAVANYDTYFVDYANGDFHSIETSPAVNGGVNTDLYTTDLDGNDRVYNNGIVDSSCYEFQGDGSVPPDGEYNLTSIGDGNVSDPTDVTTNNPFLTGRSSGAPSELTLFVGGRDVNHDGNTATAILPFKLPARPIGELVTNASLKVNVHYVKEWITSNIDLYGLPYNASNTIYSADHYDDAYTTSNGTDTAIQDNFISRLGSEANGTAYTPDREALTSSSGNSALISYINAQYDAGATEGDYIFLRLNIDVPINPSATSSLPTAASHYYGISDETTGAHAPTLALEIGAGALGVNDELFDRNSLLIYPNPSINGRVTIKSNLLENRTELEIYSVTGTLVYQKSIESKFDNKVDLNFSLPTGIYFLKLSDGSIIKSQKLIVK